MYEQLYPNLYKAADIMLEDRGIKRFKIQRGQYIDRIMASVEQPVSPKWMRLAEQEAGSMTIEQFSKVPSSFNADQRRYHLDETCVRETPDHRRVHVPYFLNKVIDLMQANI